MEQGLVGLAFTGGLVAALNPCGFALLPAYLTLVVRGEGTGPLTAVGRALIATAAMALGFLAVFSTFGLLAVSVASTVQHYMPYATVLIGIALVSVGAWVFAGRKLAVLVPLSWSSRWKPTARLGSMFGYGVGYALASLSCTVGPFLAVTGVGARRGNLLDSLWIYVAYGAGMALVAGVLAIAVAVARATLIERMRRMVRYVNRISGALLVVVGAYVAYYGIYEVRLFDGGGSPSDRVIAAAARVQGTFAEWVHQHGAWPWISAVAFLVGLAAWVSTRHTRVRNGFCKGRELDIPETTTHGRPEAPEDAAESEFCGQC